MESVVLIMQITSYTAQKTNFNYQSADNFTGRRFFMNKLSADTVCFTSKQENMPHRKEYDEKDVLRIIGIKNYVNDENIELYKDILNTVDDKYYVHFLRKPDDLVNLKFLLEKMEYSSDEISKESLHCIINDIFIKKPDKYDSAAISVYKEDGAETFNKLLIRQKNEKIPHNSEEIDDLTSYLNKKETPESVTLYRGDTSAVFNALTDADGNSIGRKMVEIKDMNKKDAEPKIAEIKNDLKNREFVQECFISTSVNKEVAEKYFNNGVLWEFNLPKGSQGAFLQCDTDNDIFVREAEFLVQRDSVIRISDIKYDYGQKCFRIKADIQTTKDHI